MFRQIARLNKYSLLLVSLPKTPKSYNFLRKAPAFLSHNLNGILQMSTYRDLSVPLTDPEIEELLRLVRTLPSYTDGDESFAVKDFPEMYKLWNWYRTPDQVAGYIAFFEKRYGGRLTLEELRRFIKAFHNSSLLAREHVRNFDRDKDGYIDRHEFQDILTIMTVHDSKLKSKTWEDFLAEADTNKDGKVSVEECTSWVAKYT